MRCFKIKIRSGDFNQLLNIKTNRCEVQFLVFGKVQRKLTASSSKAKVHPYEIGLA